MSLSLYLSFIINHCKGFPCGSAGKESACNVGDLGSIPRLGRSPGEGKGYSFQWCRCPNDLFSLKPYDSKWPSVIAQLKNPPAMQETQVESWVGKIHWRSDRLPTPVFLAFPCCSAGKESTCNAGDLDWEDPLEKGKAMHSSILAWRIPWTVEPGRLQSMGLQRVGHD